MRVKVAVLLGVALLLPSIGGAQSLAEAAAREQARRKGLKSPRVLTEEDLRRAGTRVAGPFAFAPAAEPGAAPGPEGTAAATPGEKPADTPAEKTDDEVRQEQEKAWREKLQSASDEVARLTQEQDRLQRNLNDLTTNIYGSARTTMMRQMDETKAKLAAAQQRVADLQEEGRRSRFR